MTEILKRLNDKGVAVYVHDLQMRGADIRKPNYFLDPVLGALEALAK